MRADSWQHLAVLPYEPNELCAPIHDRMPVILDKADWGRWLDEAPASANELQELLQPFPAEKMQAYKIGPAVGNVKNDDPSLIKPLAAV